MSNVGAVRAGVNILRTLQRMYKEERSESRYSLSVYQENCCIKGANFCREDASLFTQVAILIFLTADQAARSMLATPPTPAMPEHVHQW